MERVRRSVRRASPRLAPAGETLACTVGRGVVSPPILPRPRRPTGVPSLSPPGHAAPHPRGGWGSPVARRGPGGRGVARASTPPVGCVVMRSAGRTGQDRPDDRVARLHRAHKGAAGGYQGPPGNARLLAGQGDGIEGQGESPVSALNPWHGSRCRCEVRKRLRASVKVRVRLPGARHALCTVLRAEESPRSISPRPNGLRPRRGLPYWSAQGRISPTARRFKVRILVMALRGFGSLPYPWSADGRRRDA
jgi:hypothetical protein